MGPSIGNRLHRTGRPRMALRFSVRGSDLKRVCQRPDVSHSLACDATVGFYDISRVHLSTKYLSMFRSNLLADGPKFRRRRRPGEAFVMTISRAPGRYCAGSLISGFVKILRLRSFGDSSVAEASRHLLKIWGHSPTDVPPARLTLPLHFRFEAQRNLTPMAVPMPEERGTHSHRRLGIIRSGGICD
jgi:hypothetical protein